MAMNITKNKIKQNPKKNKHKSLRKTPEDDGDRERLMV